MSKKTKISSTAYRVLSLMQILNEGEYSVDALNKIFSKDPDIARTLSKEVILKYISTLRQAGYKVSKSLDGNNYKYKLDKAPVTINLTEDNLRTLLILEDYAISLYQDKLKNNYNNFLKKITRYLSEDQISMLNYERKNLQNNPNLELSKYEKYSHLIKKLERYCSEEQRITVKYRLPIEDEEKQIVLEPKSIKYDSYDVYISGYNPIIGERQLIHFNYIKEIKQLPIKSKFNDVLFPVVFRLKGRVSSGYRLYEGEKITERDEKTGTIIVSAQVDDHNMLLKRLLRYGDNCEIIFPKHVRFKAAKTIADTLKNYEEAG